MPECYLDTNLVEVLLKRPNSVSHSKGNSSVYLKMNAQKIKDGFAVGIIDDDKVKVKGLQHFDKIERLWKNGLKLYKHPLLKHYFIQFSPAVERWLLNECKKGLIRLSDYQLPENLSGLKNIKGKVQRNDDRFKRLFNNMLMNERCDEIIELKKWLEFFRDTNYNANLDIL